MELNINTDAVVKFTNTLEKLHKSALPVAIRETLNKTALDVKKDTLLKHSKKDFVNRQDNFFKANSKVEFANGFNVKSMKATVGMISLNLAGKNNYAVKDLEQQEFGGDLRGKSFIPMLPARGGNSSSKVVRPNSRLEKIKKLVVSRNLKGENKGEKFIRGILRAGVGGFVLGSTKKGENIIWRVNSLFSKLKTKALHYKIQPLYDFKKNRSIHVKPRHFMRNASIESAKGIESIYIAEARKQIKRLGAK